jgi:hypothetical protein
MVGIQVSRIFVSNLGQKFKIVLSVFYSVLSGKITPSGLFGTDRTSIFYFPVMLCLEKLDYPILQIGSSALGLIEPLSSL